MTEPHLNAARVGHLALANAAADWLVRRDKGLTPAEDGQFSAWLATSDAHAAAWSRAVALWDDFDDDPIIASRRSCRSRIRGTKR